MDQQKGAGHQAITYEAVKELFHSGLAIDGRIDGMTQSQYAHALDEAQRAQDSLLGKTTHPAQWDGEAQREHGMADPRLTGQQNLAVNQDYVENNLHEARHGKEMAHLGIATHALEDSYSEAHAWRDNSANQGDPTARIESFNVFNPLPSWHQRSLGFLSGKEGTHDDKFDHVPVGRNGELIRGTDIAAAHAVARMLITHYQHRFQNDTDADKAIHAIVGDFYRSSPSGVKVNDVWTDSFDREHDRRLELHKHEVLQYYAPQPPPPVYTPPPAPPPPFTAWGSPDPGNTNSPYGTWSENGTPAPAPDQPAPAPPQAPQPPPPPMSTSGP
jgi:hypothetical protein